MDYQILLLDPERAETYDITARTRSLTIDRRASNETNQFSLKCINIQLRHIWNEIEIYKNGTKIAGGIVVNQIDKEFGTVKNTDFQCFDYSYLFSRRLVAATYTATDFGGNPTDIIKDIVANNVSEITTTSVETSTTTVVSGDETLIFPYITVLDALTRILEHLRNWFWYVDEDLDLHLYSVSETNGPTFTGNFLINTLNVDYISDTAVNRVWVIGAEKIADDFVNDYFTGDGTKRLFKLSYEPNDFSVYEDGVENTSVALIENDDGTFDYLIDRYSQVLRVPDSKTPYTGDIRLQYKPTIQVIEQQSNPSSIETFGVYEKAVKDQDITTKLNARKIASNMLKDDSINLRIVRFATQTEVSIGQLCELNIQKGDWDIQGQFVVQGVTHYIEPSGYEEFRVTFKEVI